VKYSTIENVLSQNDLDDFVLFAKDWKYRRCPKWLGNFSMIKFDLKQAKKENIPPVVLRIAEKVLGVIEIKQNFNTIFIQKYEPGQYVKPHYDPRNNVGHTVIIPFGEFEGGVSTVNSESFLLKPGNILIQQCTIGYSIGPRHSISAIESGTRYALIFNTILDRSQLLENQ